MNVKIQNLVCCNSTTCHSTLNCNIYVQADVHTCMHGRVKKYHVKHGFTEKNNPKRNDRNVNITNKQINGEIWLD